jgi:hypothetical protein
MFFPIAAPSDPSKAMIFKISFCTIPGSFHVNLSFSGLVILEKKYSQSNHRIFAIISPLKRTLPFICTNFNSLYAKMICPKFD